MPVSTETTIARAARRLVWGLPAVITVLWLVYAVVSNQWDRILDHWRSSVTMIFGSFVAGATPQGGGAVAFPVFTKVIGTPAAVARTFSLNIQAVGMVTAGLSIILSRKPIEGRAVLAGGGAGIIGFLAGAALLTDQTTPFWDSYIPDPYVKVTFTVVLAALAYIVYLVLEEGDCGRPRLTVWNWQMWFGVTSAGAIGGATSALIGSGADVFVFLFIVVVAGLHPRVGVPSSVLAMAMVSMTGAIVLGVIDGQLHTTVVADHVVAVGGQPVDPLPMMQFDLFGMWIAAVPIVVWGAPLGTVFIHFLREKRLISFVAGMALLEVLSTAIFLDALRSDLWLTGYAVIGLCCAIVTVRWLHFHRTALLGAAGPDLEPMSVLDA